MNEVDELQPVRPVPAGQTMREVTGDVLGSIAIGIFEFTLQAIDRSIALLDLALEKFDIGYGDQSWRDLALNDLA